MLVPAQPSGHVNDYAHVLAPATVSELESLLTAHEAQTTNQVVVVTLPSLDGRDIADVTFDIGQAWKIGAKHSDNGVVFGIAPHERHMRIEVGKGLEGALTDLETQTIQQQIVIPQFNAGNVDNGVLLGTRAIVQAIQGEFKAPAGTQEHGSRWPVGIIIVILIILFICFPRAGMLLLFSGVGRGGGGFGGGGGGGGFSGGGGSFGGGGSSSSW